MINCTFLKFKGKVDSILRVQLHQWSCSPFPHSTNTSKVTNNKHVDKNEGYKSQI